MNNPSHVLAVITCAILAASPLSAQGRAETAPADARCASEFGPLQAKEVDYFPQYELRRMPPDSIRVLRRALAAECWEHALRLYFPARRSRFVNWVVYIDSAGGVRQAITRGPEELREFRGEKYVWGIVFSDRYIAPGDSARPTTPTAGGESAGKKEEKKEEKKQEATGELEFIRRSVNFQRDPLLTGLIKAVTGKFFATVETAPPPALADSAKLVLLEQLSADTAGAAGASMYVAQSRYGLMENTEVVLSVRPAPGRLLPGRLRSIYANLGNAAPSLLEIGVAGGASFGKRTEIVEDTSVVGTRSGVQPNLYLTGYLNLIRPSLPWRRFSMGPVVGMNLARGGVFDELIAGVAAGRVVGDLGLIAGANSAVVTELRRPGENEPPRKRERRRWSFFMGLDIRL